MDVKTIVADFEKRVTELKREVDTLEKKKANYEADIESLSKEHKRLKVAVDDLGKTVAEAVAKATENALDKIEGAESDVKAEKTRLDEERNLLASKIAEAKQKGDEAERLRKNLQESLNDLDRKDEEADALRSRLLSVIELIKGALK